MAKLSRKRTKEVTVITELPAHVLANVPVVIVVPKEKVM